MAKKLTRDSLGYLGVEFQYRLVKAFVEIPNFFREICNVVDQNMFTEPTLKTFVGVFKEYFDKNMDTPSYDMMEIKLREKAYGENDMTYFLDTIKKLRDTSSEGINDIHETASKFFKQQSIIKAANRILQIAGDGDISKYDQCLDIIQKSLNAGNSDDLGTHILDNLDDVLSDDYRCTIPTGIGKIDEILEGGLGKGELGVIIGPSSFGKTSLTTAMASHAATCKCEANGNKGFKVVQIVFEDRIKQIQRKHIGRLTNVEAKDLSKPDFIGTVKSKINSLEDKELIKNNVIIKKYASGEITPTQIAQYLRRLINSGFKPDLVIVDYFECLKLERGYETTDSEWTKEGVTMRKLESMASELDIALWVPTQGSRDSLGAEIVTMDKSGGSIKKIQIGHIVMSIARTMEDIAKCLATIAILKNRAGKAGDVLTGVEFNNGTCRISTDNATEYANTISFNENKKDERLELQRNLVRDIKQERNID